MEISKEDHHIFIEEQGQLPVELTFLFIDKQVADINHTFSNISPRGRGIRGVLTKEAVVMIRRKCWRCATFSSYAFARVKKHEKGQDIWMKGES